MCKEFRCRGFTDRLYWLNFRCVMLLTAICVLQSCLSPWLTFNMEAWAYVIPVAWGELGLYSGFIIWKAKNENISKHKKYKCDPDSDSGAESEEVT